MEGTMKTPQVSERPDSAQSGFSVLELTVAAAIFVVVLLAVYSLLEVGRSDRFTTFQKTEAIQNVRIALNTIGRDAINAGVGYENTGAQMPDNALTLLNLGPDADTENDILTPVVCGNGMNAVNGITTDQVTFVFVDDVLNSSAASAPSTLSAGVDPINAGHSLPVNRLTFSSNDIRLRTPDGNAATRAGDIYLIVGQTGWALGMLTARQGSDTLVFEKNDPLRLNQPGANSVIRKIFPDNAPGCGSGCVQIAGSVSKVKWVTYHVVDEDGAGPGAGTLMRTEWGGTSGSIANPLAFGILDLQVQYVLADGTVTDNPLAGPDGVAGNGDDDPNGLQMVRQVIVSVRVRSPEIDRRTNRPLEATLTSSFSTRNLVYEKH
jgi:type II secretory pathway component PulJ